MVDFARLARDSLRRERWVDDLREALAPSDVRVRSANPARDDAGGYWQVCMALPSGTLCVVSVPVPDGVEFTSDAGREEVVRLIRSPILDSVRSSCMDSHILKMQHDESNVVIAVDQHNDCPIRREPALIAP